MGFDIFSNNLDPSPKGKRPITNCGVLRRMECDSDHRSIIATILTRLKADTARSRAHRSYIIRILPNPIVKNAYMTVLSVTSLEGRTNRGSLRNGTREVVGTDLGYQILSKN